jgi:hypothetical protein
VTKKSEDIVQCKEMSVILVYKVYKMVDQKIIIGKRQPWRRRGTMD